jgi:3D (Asp-Asp-Asp) domain-containing protein
MSQGTTISTSLFRSGDDRGLVHVAYVLALGVTIALSMAVHPRTSPGADDATPGQAPGEQMIGPRCALSAGEEVDHHDGLWMLPEQREVIPFELVEAGYPDHPYRAHDIVVEITCTAYSSTIDQTDSTPFITASLQPVGPGIIALSRDLLRRYTPDAPFEFGDFVEVVGVGIFRVEDTMNRRWRRRADIWVHSRSEAMQWGRRQVLLGSIDPAMGPRVLEQSPLWVDAVELDGEPVLEVELHTPTEIQNPPVAMIPSTS